MMLLQRIVEYARTHCEATPFYKQREFQWRLELTRDPRNPTAVKGELAETRTPHNGTLRGNKHAVPSSTRTVGVAPHLGADDAQYVLGHGDKTTKPERVAQCHTAFADLITRWAEADPDCEAAQIVRDFYDQGGQPVESPSKEVGAKHGVLIVVDGQPITELESASRFWYREITARKGSDSTGVCLVCGQLGPLLQTVPGNVSKSLVPGATNNAALVSINAKTFGYDLTEGLQHTPLCLACGDALNTGLTALLSGENASQLAAQDSVLSWWTTGETTIPIGGVEPSKPEPTEVKQLLAKLRTGELHNVEREAKHLGHRFFSVVLSGNSSRIAVREWIDLPLSNILRNLATWYEQHRIQTGHASEPATYGLQTLIRATGRWDRTTKKYEEATRDRDAGRPAWVYRDLLRVSLLKRPVPPTVWHHVLRRVATDGHLDGPRVALLRLALSRHPEGEIPMSPELDDTRDDAAYLCGRLFATYETLQYQAHAGPRSRNESTDEADNAQKAPQGGVNTTFGDRHFSAAMRNPQPALLAASRLMKPWLAKLRREPTRKATATALSTQIDTLMARVSQTGDGRLPARLRPEQQAQFLLGYHGQRAHDTRQRRQRTQKNQNTDEES